jgi:Rrf2 family transcriptional regulator, iron-sulfur cluster assembly transcription factor
MIFSKSFGYVVRGMLYIALMQDEKRFVQVEEIASALGTPRHFMGKILKKLVKEQLVASSKGPQGGFSVNEKTLEVPLLRLAELTEGAEVFSTCVLMFRECNYLNPCPMHCQMENLRLQLKAVLTTTTIGQLLKENKADFIRSISCDATNTSALLMNNVIDSNDFTVERIG